jgi:hypothetical protein
LRFTDLTAGCTPVTTNPGTGVLSVDAFGDVIYVPGVPAGGFGPCSAPSPLGSNSAIDLAGFDIHFLENGSGNAVDNNVGIGFPACPPALTARLDVLQISGDIATTAINGFNRDLGNPNPLFLNPSVGVAGTSIGDPTPNAGVNVGGLFCAKQGINNQGISADFAVFVEPDCGSIVVGYDFVSAPSDLLFLMSINGDFNVDGTIWQNQGVLHLSDSIFKINKDTIANPMDIVNGLEGIYYEWDTINYPEKNFAAGNQIGFIAQEVQGVLPEAVTIGANETYYMDYNRVVPVLVEALKEMSAKVEILEETVGECCNQNLNKMGGNGGGGEGIGETPRIDVTLLPPKASELGEAKPNPFGTEVAIPFFISEEVGTAVVEFRDIFGRTLKAVEIQDKGYGELAVQAASLPNGTYLYTLVIDGQVIDTKKMLKSN